MSRGPVKGMFNSGKKSTPKPSSKGGKKFFFFKKKAVGTKMTIKTTKKPKGKGKKPKFTDFKSIGKIRVGAKIK